MAGPDDEILVRNTPKPNTVNGVEVKPVRRKSPAKKSPAQPSLFDEF